MSLKRSNTIVLLVLLAIGTVIAYLILRPFLRPIALAVVIGVAFYPLHARARRFLPQKNIHALASTLAVMLMFVVPAILLAFAASGDIIHAAQSLKDRAAEQGGIFSYAMQGPERLLNWLGQYVDIQNSGLRNAIDSLPARASQMLFAAATWLATGLAGFIGESVITLLVLFFVFRDGAALAKRVALDSPLQQERTELLFSRVEDSIFANVYGILAVGLAQGLLTGIALAILGVGSPLLLGIAAAVCSLIPLVGPALIWLPVALFLFVSGPWWKGLFLVVWGVAAVGTADNIIRPLVMAGRVNLHPLLLLFALIGGVQQFGFVGLFIGPVVVSLLLALIEMLREESNGGGSREAGEA